MPPRQGSVVWLQSFLFCRQVESQGDALTIHDIVDYVHIDRQPAQHRLAWYSSWSGPGVVGSHTADYVLLDSAYDEVFAKHLVLVFDSDVDIRRYFDSVTCGVSSGDYAMNVYLDGRLVGRFPLHVAYLR